MPFCPFNAGTLSGPLLGRHGDLVVLFQARFLLDPLAIFGALQISPNAPQPAAAAVLVTAAAAIGRAHMHVFGLCAPT